MHHHVVDLADGQVDQSPVQADVAVDAGAAPARAGAGQAELLPTHAQQGGKVVQALFKQGLGLLFEPSLRSIAHLGHRGTGRHRHGQHLLGCQVLPTHAPHTALEHTQLHGASQKRHLGPVPPLDGFLKLLGLPLFELLQLGHNPSAFFLHRGIHLAQSHPIGRSHHQTIGPHQKANALAARAFKTVRHRDALQLSVAVGGGMGEAQTTVLWLSQRRCLFSYVGGRRRSFGRCR